jgi:GNAT superfamily N-acetyltransferase
VALAADSLAWRGHLSWTIERSGGRLGGEQAGLTVGEVRRVDTREDFQGQGVATRMYHLAQRFAAGHGWPAEIDHNPDRTVQGDRWAIKAGGWRPPLTGGHHMPSLGDLRRLLEGN